MHTIITPGFREKLSSSGIRRNLFLWIILAIFLIGSGSLSYYKLIYQPRQAASNTSVMQTATARRGDLVLSASGTGTLTATDERELAFTAAGTVTKLSVQAGDQVEAGELLAEEDSPAAQTNYNEAQHKYRELTSAVAIASAQVAVTQAQTDLQRALNYLEYLISPQVLHWEQEVAQAKQDLTRAEDQAKVKPTDKNASKQLKEAEAYLAFANDMLSDAWEFYTNEYVFEHFVARRGGRRYLSIPTELEIRLARTAIDEASNQLMESKGLYEVLTGGPMPQVASSDALIELQQAKLGLQDAQSVLDGTRIFAPISGTIMAVDSSIGNTVGTGTIIVIADLSQPNLEIYLDASDWDKVAIGNQAEVTFDMLPDRVFTGQVTEVDRELYTSFNSSAIRGTVSLTEPFSDINLPMGASASLEVISGQVKNAVLVPVEALHEIGTGQYTVIVVEDNQPQLRLVDVGLRNELYAEVKSGLNEGEIVVTGLAKVK